MLSGRVKRNRLGLPADTVLREVVDDVSPSDSTSNVGSRAVAKHSLLVRDSCFVLVSRLPEKLKNIAPILRYIHNQGMTPETTDILALDYLVYQLS